MKHRANKLRNPLHGHPLLHKGGAHEKSQKAKRREEKQALRKAWRSLRGGESMSGLHCCAA